MKIPKIISKKDKKLLVSVLLDINTKFGYLTWKCWVDAKSDDEAIELAKKQFTNITEIEINPKWWIKTIVQKQG